MFGRRGDLYAGETQKELASLIYVIKHLMEFYFGIPDFLKD
jgi:hypothetical protein